MRINTNVSALTAHRNLSNTNSAVAKSMQRLSSGFRINSAGDDAAGLAIANKFRADLRSLGQASRNAEQANSVLQIAEGGADNIAKILDRMKELATQAAADAVDSDGRTQINNEFTALKNEIDRITNTVKFQGSALLNGSYGSTVTYESGHAGVYDVTSSGAAAGAYTVAHGGTTVTLANASVSQVITGVTDATKQKVNFTQFGITLDLSTDYDTGTNSLNGMEITVSAGSGGTFMVSSSGSYGANDVITLDSLDLDTTTLAIDTDSLDTLDNAETALTAIDTAIKHVNTALGKIGAAQNRIEFAQSNTETAIQNIAAAESVIRDVDMAAEMTEFTKNQILQQAGTAMLAQANSSAQVVLQLLQG